MRFLPFYERLETMGTTEHSDEIQNYGNSEYCQHVFIEHYLRNTLQTQILKFTNILNTVNTLNT